MAIQIQGKVVRLPDGSEAGPYEIVSGLSPAQEAALIQGGDAIAAGASGLVPAFFDVSGPSPVLLDPSGNPASVSGAGVALPPQFPNGQPVASAQSAKAPTLLAACYKEAISWSGTPTITTVSAILNSGTTAGTLDALTWNTDPTNPAGKGYSGIPASRTGMPSLVKVVTGTAADAVKFRCVLPSAGVPANAGLTSAGNAAALRGSPLNLGLWVFIAAVNRADVSGSPVGSIQIIPTAANGGSGGPTLSFNHNTMREGWNFLKFVDTRSTIAGGSHPFGMTPTFTADANDPFQSGNAGAVRNVVVNLINFPVGTVLYFDSVWTGLTGKGAISLGVDACGADMVTYGAPKLMGYNLPFYLAVPASVQSAAYTGSVDRVAVMSDYIVGSAITDMLNLTANYTKAEWANHTMTHVQASASSQMGALTTPIDIWYEVVAWESWRKAVGIPDRGNDWYCAPQGSWSRVSQRTIASTGTIRAQRCFSQQLTPLTPWGIPDVHNIGSQDMGDQTNAGNYTRIKTLMDIAEVYGDLQMLFWHVIQTAGDTGDTTALTGNALNVYKSTFDAVVDDVAARVAAGRVTCPSLTQIRAGA